MGSVVVLERMFVLSFPSVGAESLSFYLGEARMRMGQSDLDSPEVHGPHWRLIGPGRV